MQILESINHCINDKMARENNDKHSGQKTPRRVDEHVDVGFVVLQQEI